VGIEDAAGVELADISKAFAGRTVLDGLDLQMPGRELLALLGPSGCGKTTVLRVVAGFESPDRGRVLIGGKDVTISSVRRRGIGIVFQAYSLFPHMTASENVTYGLRVARVKKVEVAKRATELLEIVELGEHGAKYPHQLSGGEQQRVALARALAIQPKVLLLDEPLSALDARVRVQLREQIKRIHRETGTTTLLVTHDQEEALTMADRVGVMSNGRIEQLGTPEEIYHHPRTAFVSEFVGAVNRLPTIIDGSQAVTLGRRMTITNPDFVRAGDVEALIRPEDLRVEAASDGIGVISAFTLRGAVTSLEVRLDDSARPLRVDLPSPAAGEFRISQRVSVVPRRDSALVDNTQKRLEPVV